MRSHNYSGRVPICSSMKSEYQARFLPPGCYATIISTPRLQGPYHPLKGSRYDVARLRASYIPKISRKPPPKAPDSSVPVKNQISTPGLRVLPKVDTEDFQAWEADESFRLQENGVAGRGAALSGCTCKEEKNQKAARVQSLRPFESATTYRSDYIAHPLKPAQSRMPKLSRDINRGRPDGATESFKEFKLHGQNQESNPLEQKFQSPAHVGYVAHERQGTKSVQICKCKSVGKV